ncbi:hypothetical protein [Legionella brunensis]|uniref:Protein kinase domain-containing protein n=1 Tax=Legionella brunensis TaxID=29422 RepID=A0A0W0S5F3_9GAMM|nr:hypothetical protein [Legionella brunensis]KTC78269.1 hypothetical protein Lbru_2561 [Legionella brunensis]
MQEKFNAKNRPPNLKEIIKGQDITQHYLDETNKKFKIYRYNNTIYAVRCDEQTSQPIDFVKMWNSHKGEKNRITEQEAYLGAGVFGKVYKKTEDKAVKFSNIDKNYRDHEEVKKNLDILNTKFLLKENKIEEFFVLGLWNIKKRNKDSDNKDDVFFYMPQIKKSPTNSLTEKTHRLMFDKSIWALKKLNELGYAHPDLANDCEHDSSQNIIETAEGMRFIDIDDGFKSKDGTNDVVIKDQWLYAYNNNYPPNNLTPDKWRSDIQEWYKNNPGKSLSDDPSTLLNFYNKKCFHYLNAL